MTMKLKENGGRADVKYPKSTQHRDSIKSVLGVAYHDDDCAQGSAVVKDLCFGLTG